MITVGTVIKLKTKYLNSDKGTLGFCYNTDLRLNIASIILETGTLVGFNGQELESCVEIISEGISKRIEDYKFISLRQLDHEFNSGFFDKYFSPDYIGQASELEYLRWFRRHADHLAHEDVADALDREFTEETGKELPEGWK